LLFPKPLRSLHLVALALGGAGIWLAPSTARADIAVAGDLELDVPLDTDLETAVGFGVRVGWQLHLPLVVFRPEVGYHHAAFSEELTLNRFFTGVRVGFGEIFRFGFFGHVGVGNAVYHTVGADEDITDVTYDLGGYIDFTVLPLLDLGAQIGYGRMRTDEQDPLQWIPMGIHATLIF
jgi:hypothetical protein